MLLDASLPLAQFLGGLPLVAAQLGDQRDHAGVDAGHEPIGSPAFVVPAEQPGGPAGHVGELSGGGALIDH